MPTNPMGKTRMKPDSVKTFLAMLRNAKTRAHVVAALAGETASVPAGVAQGLERIGLIARPDGEAPVINDEFFADAVDALDAWTGPASVARGERIRAGDLRKADLDDAVALVARRVVSAGETVDEATLTDRLRLFVEDAAFFRRHACDLGVLVRAADGSAYHLAE